MLFFTFNLDCIHLILCDPKTCLGLWKTGPDTKGRPGVIDFTMCFFLT